MVGSLPLQVDEFVFDPRPNYPLLVTAKRYRHANGSTSEDPNALTLILAHGTGFHKEQWEPTVDDLWHIISRCGGGAAIREVWSIDCPNHGEAAVLNDTTLQWGYEGVFGWGEYARVIHMLLSGLGSGISTDFTKHRLVGIGHSMGAIALTLSLTYPSPPRYEELILVEPMLMSKANAEKFGSGLTDGAMARRDIWPTREDAFKAFSGRKSFKAWDARVLGIFCEYGLRDLPTAIYPDKTGVTLKCAKTQEAACYNDKNGRVVAYNFLSHACKALPMHFIYGAVNDYLPASTKEDVLKNSAKGLLSSIRKVEGAGHLVVQTHPTKLAEVIFQVLSTPHDTVSRSKL